MRNQTTFGIRKYKLGVASVLLGTMVVIGGLQSASADEVKVEKDEKAKSEIVTQAKENVQKTVDASKDIQQKAVQQQEVKQPERAEQDKKDKRTTEVNVQEQNKQVTAQAQAQTKPEVEKQQKAADVQEAPKPAKVVKAEKAEKAQAPKPDDKYENEKKQQLVIIHKRFESDLEVFNKNNEIAAEQRLNYYIGEIKKLYPELEKTYVDRLNKVKANVVLRRAFFDAQNKFEAQRKAGDEYNFKRAFHNLSKEDQVTYKDVYEETLKKVEIEKREANNVKLRAKFSKLLAQYEKYPDAITERELQGIIKQLPQNEQNELRNHVTTAKKKYEDKIETEKFNKTKAALDQYIKDPKRINIRLAENLLRQLSKENQDKLIPHFIFEKITRDEATIIVEDAFKAIEKNFNEKTVANAQSAIKSLPLYQQIYYNKKLENIFREEQPRPNPDKPQKPEVKPQPVPPAPKPDEPKKPEPKPEPKPQPEKPTPKPGPDTPKKPEKPEQPKPSPKPDEPKKPEPKPEPKPQPEKPTPKPGPDTPKKPEQPKPQPEEPKKPEQPKQPEMPKQPEHPQTPEKPGNPDQKAPQKPHVPEKPEHPSKPITPAPEHPEVPSKPSQLSKPGQVLTPQPEQPQQKHVTPDAKRTLPNTGDTSQPQATTLFGAIALLFGGLFLSRRKKHREE